MGDAIAAADLHSFQHQTDKLFSSSDGLDMITENITAAESIFFQRQTGTFCIARSPIKCDLMLYTRIHMHIATLRPFCALQYVIKSDFMLDNYAYTCAATLCIYLRSTMTFPVEFANFLRSAVTVSILCIAWCTHTHICAQHVHRAYTHTETGTCARKHTDTRILDTY